MLRLLFNHNLDRVCLILPQGFILEQIDVHQLLNFLDDISVNFLEFSILSDQLICHLSNSLCVLFDIDRVLPSDVFPSAHVPHVALTCEVRVLDLLIKLLCHLDHHWFLTVDNLRTHRIVEVSDLLQADAFLVELLGSLNDFGNPVVNREAELTDCSAILDEGHEVLTVVDTK